MLPGQGAVSKRDRSGGGDSVSTVAPSKENSVCVGVMIPPVSRVVATDVASSSSPSKGNLMAAAGGWSMCNV